MAPIPPSSTSPFPRPPTPSTSTLPSITAASSTTFLLPPLRSPIPSPSPPLPAPRLIPISSCMTPPAICANPFGDITTSSDLANPVKYDLYAFMPDAGGNTVVTASGPLDTQFRLYNASGNPISNLIDANGPGASETLTIGLNSGVWYYI